MKLSREQIDKLSRSILETLRDKHLMVIKSDEHKVIARITEVMLKDMHAEEDLDREVEKVLEAHTREITSGKLDYKRMFTMLKAKLAKERGIVL